jgi:hypothetical protein
MAPFVAALLSAALAAPAPASAPPSTRTPAASASRKTSPVDVPLPPPPNLKARLPRMLVLEFSVHGEAARELGRTLADVAVREIARVGGYQVLSQADVLAQLGVEQQRVFMGCGAESSCLAEIAGAIDADRTVTGSVTKLGDGYFVTAKMVDARKIAMLGNADETLKSPRTDELIEAARRVVYRAVTGRQREAQAIIEFDVADAAARILLDGEEIGRGPFKDVRRVGEGIHRVVVAKEGYAAWENVYQLEAGGRASVSPRLVSVGGGRKVLGWTAFGAGIAAVALGGASVWQETAAKSHYSHAKGLLGAGGVLPVTASSQDYQDSVSAGNSAHRNAVVLGVGAGVAAATSLVLGYVAYRQTGEIGPFRF